MSRVYATTRLYKGREREIFRAEWRDPKKRGRDKRCYKDFAIEGGKRRETERKVQAFARKKEREVEQGILTADSQSVTFAVAYDDWIQHHGRKLTGGTRETYALTAKNHILPEIGEVRLTKLNPVNLQEFMDRVIAKGHTGIPVRVNTILHGVFRNAIRRGWLGQDPLRDQPLFLPKVEELEVELPTAEEVQALLRAMDHRRANGQEWTYRQSIPLVHLALFTGMRRGEICALRWESIDWDRKQIEVRRSISRQDGLKTTKTKAGRRSVYMTPELETVLRWHADWMSCPLFGYLLRRRNGGPEDYLHPDQVTSHYWPQICKAAGLLRANSRSDRPLPRYKFHALRHHAISQMAARGVHVLHMMKQAGHSDPAMTLGRYGHVLPTDESVKLAIDGLASEFAATTLPEAAAAHTPSPDQRRLAERAIELKGQGIATETIAGEAGCSKVYVNRLIRLVQPKPESQKALEAREFAAQKAVKEDLRAQIVALRADGLTIYQIAARLGVPKSTVHRRISGPKCDKSATTPS